MIERYPGAKFVGANEANVGGPLESSRVRLFVIHVAQSRDQGGIDAWFNDPRANVSAHFSVGTNGAVHQYVSLSRQAWAQASYNDEAISIEHVGYSGERLTRRQLKASLALLRWLHERFAEVPLRRTANVAGYGVIGHAELGVAGGDHPDCPGGPIVDQFDVALRKAQGKRRAPRRALRG